MAPAAYTDDSITMQNKKLFFEASILHRIPTKLLVQSSSTPYFQSFPNGEVYRNWLYSNSKRRERKTERLRKLAKFHAELLGKSIEIDSTSGGDGSISIHGDEKRLCGDEPTNNKKNDSANVIRNSLADRDELLVDITLRTMVLLHHNQQLQNKLTALQMETKNFVGSCTHNRDRDRGRLTAASEKYSD